MPLDRRITLRLEALGTRDGQGRYVPGPVTLVPVWAERMDSGSTDVTDIGGTSVRSVVSWTIRYRLDVVRQRIDLFAVIDELGNRYNVEEVTESDARRRFLTIQAISRLGT